jgi:bifunctional non-homologous end joining protein LigD
MQKRLMLRRPSEVALAASGRLRASFYAFDLLGLESYDLRALPLRERKALLRALLPRGRGGAIRYVDHVETEGLGLYDEVRKLDLEGMVAKRAEAPYSGGRSSDWVKVPVSAPRSSWSWVHAAGTGHGRRAAPGRAGARGPRLRGPRGLRPVRRAGAGPRGAGRVPARRGGVRGGARGRDHTWVEPRVVCEVRYRERTEEGYCAIPFLCASAASSDGAPPPASRRRRRASRPDGRGPVAGPSSRLMTSTHTR